MADIDELVAVVRKSVKYKLVCEDIVRGVGERELAKGRRLKEAIKATKKKLHQVGGAYLEGRVDYAAWLDELRAVSGGKGDFRRACARIMGHHSSTKERLEILDTFYATVLADLPPIRSVLDLACGLNPLAIPWMAENVPAILQAWHGGIRAGRAVADILSGAVSPSGKLTATFPRAEGQIPVYYAHKSTGRPMRGEGTLQFDEPYRSNYLDEPNTPLFPFGYGLSYSTFAYGGMKLSSTKLEAGQPLTVAPS